MSISEQSKQYNQIYNQYNKLYHDIATAFGFSDTQYWLLYTLYIDDAPVTQNDLAMMLSTPKQTVHSAVAKLAEGGFLVLTQQKGPRNSKAVALTEAGLQLCERCVKPLLEAEERAMQKISAEERAAFLAIYEKRFHYFDVEIQSILKGAEQL